MFLEDHAPVVTGAGDRRALVQDLAARGAQEAGDDVEKRRLAAAGGAERHYELVL